MFFRKVQVPITFSVRDFINEGKVLFFHEVEKLLLEVGPVDKGVIGGFPRIKGLSRFVDERFDIFSACSFVLGLEVKRKSFVFDLSVNTGHFPQILGRLISTLLYTSPQRYQVLKDVAFLNIGDGSIFSEKRDQTLS